MQNIRNKMTSRGVEALDDRELLSLLLEDEQLAEVLLSTYGGSLSRLTSEPEARLRMVGGLGLKRARMLLLATEFGRRVAAAGAAESDFIATSDDVVRIFRPQLERLSHEECWAVYLTASNRVIERQRVSQGGVTGTVVDHRLIVKRALELLATQLILIHNHPSGTPDASAQDRALTERIANAAALFDIRLLDHVIIARGGGDFSFRCEGLIR
ncbi:JAB domain-containing protein [Alistipes sp.]|uniref:JAB domain-containing protein n=1 Tax=Alistipes sp. TaxID=1872444 RepID=UPI003A86C780